MTKQKPRKEAKPATTKGVGYLGGHAAGYLAQHEGRKAAVALYVMLEPDEKERYEAFAKELGLTMRDLVRLALNRMLDERNAAMHQPPEHEHPATAVGYAAALEQFRAAAVGEPLRVSVQQTMQQSLRLARLEDRVNDLEQALMNVARNPGHIPNLKPRT